MDVKDAVKKAIQYVADIFSEENPENIGLEEVYLDEHKDTWEITVGFSRPWDHRKSTLVSVAAGLDNNPIRRYKVVTIDNATEEVKAIKIRSIENE